MIRQLKRYIKDLAIERCIADDISEVPKFNFKKVHRHFLSAIRNYASLRLKILKNEAVTEIEHKILITLIKAGVSYAIKEYKIDVGTCDINSYVDKIAPDVLKEIRQLRVKGFTLIVEYTSTRISDESK